MDQKLLSLLELIAEQDGVSLAKAAKKLGLAQSQLLRLLATLAEDTSVGGVGFVEVRSESSRTLLHLSPQGKKWMAEQA